MKNQLKQRFRDPEGDDGADLSIDELEEIKEPWWKDEGSVKETITIAVMRGALRAAFVVGVAATLVFAFFKLMSSRGL